MHAKTESDQDDRVFGAIVAVLIAASFIWIYHYSEAPTKTSRLAPAQSVARSTFEPSPLIVSTSAAPQRNSIAEVYECEKEGQRVLSDRPCGPSPKVLKIMAPNRMNPHDTSGFYGHSISNGSFSTSRPRKASYQDQSSLCPSIEAQIDAINARMRQAYTSQEGEKLRRRLRQLSDERHDARCIR